MLRRWYHRLLGETGVTRFLSPPPGLLVLMYHSVVEDGDDTEYPYVVEVSQLRRQLELLREWGDVVSITEGVYRVEEDVGLDGRPTAVTFDDGLRDNLTRALPLLEEYQIPATFFLSTELLNSPLDAFMNWDEARELADHPLATVGSHGRWHQNLSLLSESDVAGELEESRKALEERLDVEVEFVSYPGGGANPTVLPRAEAAGYRAGFLDRMSSHLTGRYALGRASVDVHNASPDAFRGLLAAGRRIRTMEP